MKEIKQGYFDGERALFNSKDLFIKDSVFANGESPLKESSNIEVMDCMFKWKYVFWYCQHIKMNHSTLLETARSSMWYVEDIQVKDSIIEAPKAFRRSSHILLDNVQMPNALETFWNCHDIEMKNVSVNGNYFGFNSENIHIDGLNLTGNYAFDGCKNMEVRHATLVSKDAFWNCENITVYDSTIIGEYLAWNAKNIKFVNCTIESEQGLCYMDHVILENCKLIHTSLAFEYCSNIEADIISTIDSIKNPYSGRIKALGIKEMELDETKIDPSKTIIIQGE